MNNEMNVPPATPLEQGGPNLPNCLVGDEGFGLSTFLLRPYPRSRGLNLRQKVFDYRLSRARRIAECGFGTWTQTWRVFRSDMVTSLKVGIQSIHACTCLHNFLIMHEERRFRKRRSAESKIQNHNYQYVPEEEVVPRQGTLERMRYDFSIYYVGEGAIDCQWEKARTANF
ncbi:hypothetical protein QAD02_002557 [Eretmocerus hayati]|uniref:Uncharacterized protein n=1 Tax=Eretmocerus hayati TaxID=131215 RepID=A0ACC2NKF4_9HYME|nr:hypothetical protein QAD02_002557 [Eretmocerus hayati]